MQRLKTAVAAIGIRQILFSHNWKSLNCITPTGKLRGQRIFTFSPILSSSFGSGSRFDPDSIMSVDPEPGYGYRRAKMTPKAGLRIRIRIRIGSGFNRFSGSGSVSESGSGSRRAKMTHKRDKSRIFFEKFTFWSDGWPLLRAEGFFCNLDFLYGGLGIGTLNCSFWSQKILIFFPAVTVPNFFQFLSLKPWIRIGSGSVLDPDRYSA